MIGDETIAEDPETLVAFLTEKGEIPGAWTGSDDVIFSIYRKVKKISSGSCKETGRDE